MAVGEIMADGEAAVDEGVTRTTMAVELAEAEGAAIIAIIPEVEAEEEEEEAITPHQTTTTTTIGRHVP